MTFVARIKRWIKSHPIGLYLVEKRKKRVYEARLLKYSDREYIDWLHANVNDGKVPNLECPKTFTDKLQWMKLYYRDPLMTRCSDKLELKDYLCEQGLGELAVPTLAVYTRAEDVDERALPSSFVLKAAHGCGWQWVCCGDKTAINWKWAKKTMAVWLSETLYMFGREWNYKDQTPRMIAEPLLSDKPPDDYKLMCFHGVVKIVQHKHEVDGQPVINLYDPDWTLIKDAATSVYPCDNVIAEKPVALERMIEVAEKLSKPFPFVRVDMYCVHGKIYVGEMTFFPSGGFYPFVPTEIDELFGEWLTLPPKNHE